MPKILKKEKLFQFLIFVIILVILSLSCMYLEVSPLELVISLPDF